MKFEITSYEAFGNISFGMTRQEVRPLLDLHVTEFKRNEFSKGPTDFFSELGLFVNYEEQLRCVAFEVATPCEPVFKGVNLLMESYESLKNWISAIDSEIVEKDTGLTSFKFGFGLYAPYKNEFPLENCEAVIVFRKGYYDA